MGLLKLLVISIFLLGASFSSSEEVRTLTPFTTDGCSWSPDGNLRSPTKYLECCKLHDFEYWMGGTRAQRKKADKDFRQCLRTVGASHPVHTLYYRAVRANGGPRGCSFCWGYGWSPRTRGYAPFTPEEMSQIPEMTKEEILATPVTKSRNTR